MTANEAISVREISPGTSLVSRAGRRSAITGHYVTAATAARHPRTTVVETTGGAAASTFDGRYVPEARSAGSKNAEPSAMDAEVAEGR